MALILKPVAILPSHTLEPLVQLTWKYVDAEHLAKNGIYTADNFTRFTLQDFTGAYHVSN